MAVTAVSAATPAAQAPLGLDFQSLLNIILTQLTNQDPLKPLDNFEFVSQLAQFAQLQQSQTLNDQITSLLAAQSTTEATSLLGKTVDLTSAQATATTPVTGTVSAISFSSGQPQLTITTATGQTISGISISDIAQVR
ncbi:MAG: flagellar hook capping FlgD N-terminal domain-containing protein [Caulobacterales bacterium]